MKTNILKISALCASLSILASSANAQIVGFNVTDTNPTPTSNISMVENSSSAVYGVRAQNPYASYLTSVSVKVDVTNTGTGTVYGVGNVGSGAGASAITISNDIYVSTNGTSATAITGIGAITLQGDITISAKSSNAMYSMSMQELRLYSNGGIHTLFGGLSISNGVIYSGKYIWDSYGSFIYFNMNSGISISAGVEIEFMKSLTTNAALNVYGSLSFHVGDIFSDIMTMTSSYAMTIGSSAQFTLILDYGFEALTDDSLTLVNGTITGSFDSDNVSIMNSITGEYLNYGTDFTVSGREVTFLRDITVIPEPSTYAAIIGVLAFGLAIYRRRK